jgi:hypothetical protein
VRTAYAREVSRMDIVGEVIVFKCESILEQAVLGELLSWAFAILPPTEQKNHHGILMIPIPKEVSCGSFGSTLYIDECYVEGGLVASTWPPWKRCV